MASPVTHTCDDEGCPVCAAVASLTRPGPPAAPAPPSPEAPPAVLWDPVTTKTRAGKKGRLLQTPCGSVYVVLNFDWGTTKECPRCGTSHKKTDCTTAKIGHWTRVTNKHTRAKADGSYVWNARTDTVMRLFNFNFSALVEEGQEVPKSEMFVWKEE
jgi:hypothetical protein